LCSQSEIWLTVSPGYGASKKPSFTQPDVWAILSYELRLKPESPPGDDPQKNDHLSFVNEERSLVSLFYFLVSL
jgi:hypothetical protein